MSRSRSVIAGAAITVLATALSLGAVATAQAAPAHAPTSTARSSAQPTTLHVAFNLLAPNSPVVFTIAGTVIATGTTNSNGDVRLDWTATGYEVGYHTIRATETTYGIWSEFHFGTPVR